MITADTRFVSLVMKTATCLRLSEADKEVTFYDTVENPEDLDEEEEDNLNLDPETKARLHVLRNKLMIVYKKRAQLRNRKV